MREFAEYGRYDGLGLAELVRRREVSAEEVLESAIARVEERDRGLGAVCRQSFDVGRAAIRAGLPDGPFTGVPLLLKDLTAVARGLPMSSGSRFFADAVSEVDSTVVERLRAAGFVLFGRTATPELGMSPTTEAVAYGRPTRNPWNTERSSGGSSGGSAAAVASSMVPIGHGGDGAGSLRIPASCCGLFGLKPSRGRNPAGPLVGEGWAGLAGDHVVTRSVRDSAAVLDAIAGPDAGAPYGSPPAPASGTFLDATRRPPGRLRIARTAEHFLAGVVDPEVAAGVEATARLLEGLGHQVEEAMPEEIDFQATLRAMVTLIACGAAFAVGERSRLVGHKPSTDQLEPSTWGALELASRTTGAQYLAAVAAIHRAGRRLAPFFGRYDLLLSPTLALPPPPLGRYSMHKPDFLDYRMGPEAIGAYSPYTPIANATGLPAMSVPLAWTGDGLPVGMHFIGRFGAEAELLALAAQLEEAKPWFDRRPAAFPA